MLTSFLSLCIIHGCACLALCIFLYAADVERLADAVATRMQLQASKWQLQQEEERKQFQQLIDQGKEQRAQLAGIQAMLSTRGADKPSRMLTDDLVDGMWNLPELLPGVFEFASKLVPLDAGQVQSSRFDAGS